MTVFADYVAHGWRLCRISPGTKGPRARGWQLAANAIKDPAKAVRLQGAGLLHAYSGTCAIDLDDLQGAAGWLSSRGVDLAELLAADDAVQIRSGRPNRAKLLYRLPPGCEPLATQKIEHGGVVLLELRCVSAEGLSVQDVLPPSIHPDTGKPYKWAGAGKWDRLPELPAQLLQLWRDRLKPSAAPSGMPAPGAPIPEGQRNDTLFKVACNLRGNGYGEATILAALASENLRCTTPLTDTELRTIAHSAARYDAGLPREKAGGQLAFEVIPAADFAAGEPPEWIVEDLLPAAELAVIFGESGCGKSFLVLDLACAIARGTPWRNLAVKRGRVVYVAAEAAGGVRQRLRAMAVHHGIDLAGELGGLGIVGQAPNLLTDDDQALAKAIELAGGASVVIVDTLAQATPGGNENAGEDMGKALARCKRLHAATGALVVLIHHAGKDATKGARGWSGLRAAADVEIEVSRLGENRTARVTKQKEGEDGLAFAFRLASVPLGARPSGKPITSCVVQHLDQAPPVVREPVGKWERVVWKAACELLDLGDAAVQVDPLIESAVRAVPHDSAAGRDRRREYARRALSSLCDSEFLVVLDNSVSLPHAAQTPHAARAAVRQSPESMPHMPHGALARAACGRG